MQQNEAREMLGLEPVPDGDRWFPGTGDPAEIERQQEQQDQQHQQSIAALQQRQLAGPKPNGDDEKEPANGKPAMNGNGKKRWEY